jgi:hypothetical protein
MAVVQLSVGSIEREVEVQRIARLRAFYVALRPS